MAAFGHDSVTIDRVHFETLVRRANINSDPSNDTIPMTAPLDAGIYLSRTDYDNLLHAAQQYVNLKQNLLRGGVVEETIALLSRDDETIQNENQPVHAARGDNSAGSDWGLNNSGTPICPSSASVHSSPFKRRLPGDSTDTDVYSGYNYTHVHGHTHSICSNGGNGGPSIMRGRPQPAQAWSGADDEAGYAAATATPRAQEGQGQGYGQLGVTGGALRSGPVLERSCKRTVQILNMPDGTTHTSLAAVIRGGPLLEMYIRMHDSSAMVSFLYPADAAAFFEHVQKHGLYIKQRRVTVCWAERQFVLPGHVANKIRNGATRNVVIRRCSSHITEKTIREDLDHIHNIVVLKVEFIGGNCYIGTNSVHNALFARTCMISRLKFKRSKIEWYPDECAQPLECVHPVFKAKKTAVTAKQPPMLKVANRFQLLNLDMDNDENNKNDEEDSERGDAIDSLLIEGNALATSY